MKTTTIMLLAVSVMAVCHLFAQENEKVAKEEQAASKKAEKEINRAEFFKKNMGVNTYLNNKVSRYLTGESDLALSTFYGIYSADNDRLNLGFNIPLNQKRNLSLCNFILNPTFEMDVKNSFATIYKNGKHRSDIRGGLKVTWVLKPSRRNDLEKSYFETPVANKQKSSLLDEIDKLEQALSPGAEMQMVDGKAGKNFFDAKFDRRTAKKNLRNKYLDFGKLEADIMEINHRNNWLHLFWVSAWTMLPITEANRYISPAYTQSFENRAFHLWDINIQGNWRTESKRVGAIFVSAWAKYFQNNSAVADLMNEVQFEQYAQMPQTNLQNLALLESDKAYVGDFRSFQTFTSIIQAAYFLPLDSVVVTPGISVRYEKNWGTYSPQNFRFGIPLSIKGKESKPITIELQYRLTDFGNYLNAPDHKPGHTFGISLGLPIVELYK